MAFNLILLIFNQKKALKYEGFSRLNQIQLFDFSFFVHHMLTNNRIKFFDLHFFRHGAFVFICGVEVASFGAGNESYFVTHLSTP